ncbi:MAG: hypothetical protein E7675_05585 [Ruminococcaceae bacterium]|nr:hypothetical protein [Oscillospiraceae bacterium]
MKKHSPIEITKFILSNICFILSIVLITFTVLDRFNPLIGFISSFFSQCLFMILMVSSLILALLFIIDFSKKK